MTGEDHNTDALIAALRSPALPAEQAGEAAAVTAMLEVLPATASGRSTGLRSRRGVAVAAVTVASLGVGGLVAAGPGIFQPAADRPDTTDALEVVPPTDGEQGGDDAVVATTPTTVEPGTPGTDVTGDRPEGETVDDVDGDVECVGDTHGDTVSSVAKSTEAEGRDKGAAVREAAQSACGKDRDDAPGKSDDAPGQTGDAPGQTGDTPGQSGETPGQSGETPGKSDAPPPGQSGATPGQSGETPGKSKND